MATRRRKTTLTRRQFDGPEQDLTIEVGYQSCAGSQWIKFTDQTGENEIFLEEADIVALAYLMRTTPIFSECLNEALEMAESNVGQYDIYLSREFDENSWEIDEQEGSNVSD